MTVMRHRAFQISKLEPMNTASDHQYLALRRYAFYLMRFCEEIEPSETEESVRELYEPICTMLELLAELSGTDFRNPLRATPATSSPVKASDLLQIVPSDAYAFDGTSGWYSFSFGPAIVGNPAKLYTSSAEVPAFALVSCYLQFLYDIAFHEELSAPGQSRMAALSDDSQTLPPRSAPASRASNARYS